MIYLHDLRTTAHASPALVAKLFGLAPAEARLAILLGEGLTLREAAAKMGITENSVRSYSKNIFHKTGLNRQAEIVRLIQRSMALFAA
jgi:DNA-binding CsgD family transcriptional regulator